tara:strand:- start:191 stop:562 length:372 start_codon:yes stop_codon:yes gene_type:complete
MKIAYIKNIHNFTEIMKDKIEITKNAQKHISSVLKAENSKYFRITVLGGGCAGFQYKFEFENIKKSEDILFDNETASVIIDETSLKLINGSIIDYVDELIGSSFKISNPQATSSCGCGTSFSI